MPKEEKIETQQEIQIFRMPKETKILKLAHDFAEKKKEYSKKKRLLSPTGPSLFLRINVRAQAALAAAVAP